MGAVRGFATSKEFSIITMTIDDFSYDMSKPSLIVNLARETCPRERSCNKHVHLKNKFVPLDDELDFEMTNFLIFLKTFNCRLSFWNFGAKRAACLTNSANHSLDYNLKMTLFLHDDCKSEIQFQFSSKKIQNWGKQKVSRTKIPSVLCSIISVYRPFASVIVFVSKKLLSLSMIKLGINIKTHPPF